MRKLKLAASFAIAVVLLGALGGYAYLRRSLDAAVATRGAADIAAWRRHREPFLADQALAASLPILQRRPGGRDAGPFLNPRVAWDCAPARCDHFKATVAPGAPGLALPRERMSSLPARWWEDPRSWAGLDFSWFAELAGFDHWDLEVSSPLSERGPRVPFARLPWEVALDTQSLHDWASLRLARALAERDAVRGLAEVAELGRLLLTTERHPEVRAGLELLRMVDRARLRAGRAGLDVRGVASIDGETLRRLGRALDAAGFFVQLNTPAAARGDADLARFGICAALEAELSEALRLRPVLPHREADFARLGARLEAEHECRLRWLRRSWNDAAPRAPLERRDLCADPTDDGLPRTRGAELGCLLQLQLLKVPGAGTLLGDFMAASGSNGPMEIGGVPRSNASYGFSAYDADAGDYVTDGDRTVERFP